MTVHAGGAAAEFLTGGGEMGERLRAHDWTGSPLGAPGVWPPALRTAVGIMLNSRHPMFLAWGPQLIFLYNDGYIPVLGAKHPSALARPFAAIWDEIWDDIEPLIAQALAGEPTWSEDMHLVMQRHGYPEDTWYTFSYSPIRDSDGAVGGMFCACTETTGKVVAERRLKLLVELGDRLREFADPAMAKAAAAGLLGERLGVGRVGYAEIDPAGEIVHIERDWTDGTIASLSGGAWPLEAFGPQAVAELKAGRTLRIDDIAADPLSAPYKGAYDAVQAGAVLAVPLLKDERLTAILHLSDLRPRRWTDAEASLAQDVAERTWDAVERARTEMALRESEARFRAMADSAPSPVWVTSAPGGIEFVNQAFVDIAGRPREDLLGDVWLSLIHPDDILEVARRRQVARETFDAYWIEARFRMADGGWRLLRANSKPRFDGAGAFQGYVGMAVDVSEMRAAEAALRESEERFRLVAEGAPVMLWMGDEEGRCLYLNKALRDFWGVPEDLSGFSWADTILPQDAGVVFAGFGDGMARQAPFETEGRYLRADGTVRTLFTRAEPRRDADGRFVGMIGVNVDVTDARMAETHQQLLINELNHRVKNTLATVQSISHQTLREGVVTREARDLLTARLLALSAAHNVLTRENWEGAELREVAAEAVRPYEGVGASRIFLEGEAVRVGPRVALALSMALHELATNAAKYGALSNAEGRIAIGWKTAGVAGLELEWRESGGPPVTAPARTGFGSRLLGQGLATELGWPAQLSYAPEGLTCLIRSTATG